MHAPHIMTGGRYPVLRTLAILYLILGALAAVLGLIAAIWVLVQLGDRTLAQRLWLAATTLGGAVLAVISMLAVAEGIKLFIDIAEGVRVMRDRAAGGTASTGEMAGDGHRNRVAALDEETAEAALLRGH
jgi:hypothetical protein